MKNYLGKGGILHASEGTDEPSGKNGPKRIGPTWSPYVDAHVYWKKRDERAGLLLD